MVVKNNYYWLREYDEVSDQLIANGDIVEVVRVIDRFSRYGYEYAEVDVVLVDLENSPNLSLTVMTTLLNDNRPSLSLNENKEMYKKVADDYIDLGTKSKIHAAIIRDQCYQALHVKYAYSLTCHKAQGGQWPAIILDQGYLNEEMIEKDKRIQELEFKLQQIEFEKDSFKNKLGIVKKYEEENKVMSLKLREEYEKNKEIVILKNKLSLFEKSKKDCIFDLAFTKVQYEHKNITIYSLQSKRHFSCRVG